MRSACCSENHVLVVECISQTAACCSRKLRIVIAGLRAVVFYVDAGATADVDVHVGAGVSRCVVLHVHVEVAVNDGRVAILIGINDNGRRLAPEGREQGES